MIVRDQEHAQGLEGWLATRTGKCFAQASEELVLSRLAHWAKSGRTLLEVNCGLGQLQQPLRGMGLDVTGLEPSPALRQRFVQILGPRYLMDPGHADLLPHGDGSFDWVLLHLERGLEPNFLENAIAEARRVAKMGVAVLLWNRYSLASLLPAREKPPFTAFGVLKVCRLLKRSGEGRVSLCGRLHKPLHFWKAVDEDGGTSRKSRKRRLCAMRSFCRRINLHAPVQIASPFAAVCLVTLELPPSRPMTATPIKFKGFKFASQGLVEGCSDRSYRDGKSLQEEASQEENLPGKRLREGLQEETLQERA